MSPVHFHLYFSHFPIAGSIIGLLVLVFGHILQQKQVLKTGLWILFLSSFAVFAMNASGEEAEEIVENLPGITHQLIHEREEAAEKVVWLALITGLGSLFVLWAIQTGHKVAKKASLILIFIAFASAVGIVYTAAQGGLIRHSSEMGEQTEYADELTP